MRRATQLPLGASLVLAVVFVLMLLAFLLPGRLWGLNFHTFVPIYLSGLAIALALGSAKLLHRFENAAAGTRSLPSWLLSTVLALLMAALFYNFPIQTKLYGDTHIILRNLGIGGVEFANFSLSKALSLNIFSAQNGETFSYGLAKWLHPEDATKSFRAMSAFWGMLYVFVWVEFVQHKLQGLKLRTLGILMGLTAGVSQVFFGHVEVYAAPMFAFMLFMVLLTRFVDSPEKKWLFMLSFALLFAVRTHSAGFALVPAYLYALLCSWAGTDSTRVSKLAWRKGTGAYVLGVLGLGIAGFWALFKAGKDGVIREGKPNYFLRLWPEGEKENAYAMLSGWHLWDFANVILLSAAMAVAVLLLLLFAKDSKAITANASLRAALVALIFLAALFFAVDPQLSMPRDWDLMVLPGPILLVTGLLALAQLQSRFRASWLPSAILISIGLWQASAFLVNSQPKMLHQRLLTISTHIFQTGKGGAAFIFRNAAQDQWFTEAEQTALLQKAFDDWQPFAQTQSDLEFSFLCHFIGSHFAKVNDFGKAIKYYEAGSKYQTQDFSFLEDLAVAYHKQQNMGMALEKSLQALKMGSQNPNTMGIATIAAASLGNTSLAMSLGKNYLSAFPQDPMRMRSWIEQLLGGQSIGNASQNQYLP